MGADTSVVKKKIMKFNSRRRRVDGETPRFERRREKGDGRQHGRLPRIPEPFPKRVQ